MSPTARCSGRSPSTSPTTARTRSRWRPWPAATATNGSSAGRRSGSGTAPPAGITFVWARVDDEGAEEHGAVRCFLVEQDTPGYTGNVIRGKASLRAIHQAHIVLDDVRVPLDAVLPGTKSFKDASIVLYATRSGVAWSALGHATACYESALAYATPAGAVRKAARQVPDGPGAPHPHARGPHRHAAVLPAHGRPPRRPASCARPRRRWRSSTTREPRAGSPRPPATCSVATASSSRTA